MKRLVSALLILTAVFCLYSCKEKNREYDETELKEASCDLIEKSKLLNQVYWGTGIEYIKDESTSNGSYYEANYLHLEKLGFSTIEELKELTRGVFSKAYSEDIFKTSLSSVSYDTGIAGLARYYQKYKDLEMTEPDTIMVYSEARVLLVDDVIYDYNSITVEGSKGQIVYVTLNAQVTRGDKSQIRKVKVGLIEEENGWRLNDATYVSYNENLDK